MESANLANQLAREGCDRCRCGCKYWENDRCVDCDTAIGVLLDNPEWVAENRPTGPKYPDVHVELVGHDGNAFNILGRVAKALRRAGVSQDERDQFHVEATSGDYDHLLATAMRWVEVS